MAARDVRAEILAPAAASVDLSGVIPTSHFDELASRGFYGVAFASEDPIGTLADVGEILVSGCLATAFVWAQHHGTLLRLAGSRNEALKNAYLSDLQSGARRAAVSGSGYARPDGPLVRARRTGDGYRITGKSPFVTGWGLTDVIGVTAYDETSDESITFMTAVKDTARMRTRRLELSAAHASHTVELEFDEFDVPDESVVHVARNVASRRTELSMLDRAIVRINGSLALGTIRGSLCALDDFGRSHPALESKYNEIKAQLDAAARDRTLDIFAARARACNFAVDVAAYYAATVGSRAVRRGDIAERLVREANFGLVCTTSSEMKNRVLAAIEGHA